MDHILVSEWEKEEERNEYNKLVCEYQVRRDETRRDETSRHEIEEKKKRNRTIMRCTYPSNKQLHYYTIPVIFELSSG
jgi:hypothetical protein